MRLKNEGSPPEVLIRLEAQLDDDGEVDENIFYILETDTEEEPTKAKAMHRHDRAMVVVHYLPAQRNPSEQLSFAAKTMLGKALRSANWKTEKEALAEQTLTITNTLAANAAVSGISAELDTYWKTMHRGKNLAKPAVTFGGGELETLLRHLTIGFSPSHHEGQTDASQLSDGQQSLLYLSLALSMQAVGKKGPVRGARRVRYRQVSSGGVHSDSS